MDACRLCGSSEWEVGGEHDCCEECSMYIAPEMVRLGLSIRRFVRRAEVADIRRDVLMMTVEAAAAAMHGATRSGEEIIRRQAKALDRLAALAMLEVE